MTTHDVRLARAVRRYQQGREEGTLPESERWPRPRPAGPGDPDLNQWDNVVSIRTNPRWRWHKG